MALTVCCRHESDGCCKQPVICGGKLFCQKEPDSVKAAHAEVMAKHIRESWRHVFSEFAAGEQTK